LPIIATLDDLSEEALIKVLTEPKNALVKQYKTMFEMENVKLTFTDEALKAIAQKAIVRKTGARGLRAIMEEALLDLMYEVPDHHDLSEIVIDDKVINDGKAPKFIHTRKKAV
jgi:ATP-dependent Clp protease ATP-binding subunit ClpX